MNGIALTGLLSCFSGVSILGINDHSYITHSSFVFYVFASNFFIFSTQLSTKFVALGSLIILTCSIPTLLLIGIYNTEFPILAIYSQVLNIVVVGVLTFVLAIQQLGILDLWNEWWEWWSTEWSPWQGSGVLRASANQQFRHDSVLSAHRMQKMIERLPVLQQLVTADEICSICYDVYKPGILMLTISKCGHRFHMSCLCEWLCKKNNCPMCRRQAIPN